MRHILTFSACFFFSMNILYAQVHSVDVPATSSQMATFLIPAGTFDSIDTDQSNILQGEILVCQNSTLVVTGLTTTLVNFYLQEGSHLILIHNSLIGNIHAKNMSTIDLGNSSPNLNIYREASVVLMNTGNATINLDSVNTSVNFTYNGWGNGNPCSPNSLKDVQENKGVFQIKHHVLYYNSPEVCDIYIINSLGQIIWTGKNMKGYGMESIPFKVPGIYFMQVRQKENVRTEKFWAD